MEIHSRETKASKWDNLWVGLALALIVPVLVMIFYWYAAFYPNMTLVELLTRNTPAVLMKIISLCASPDLLLFAYFTHKNWSNGYKGMVLAIFILLIITLIIKCL